MRISVALPGALIAGLALFAMPAFASLWGQSDKLDLPPPAPVVDEFGLLDVNQRAQLDQLLREIKSRSGVEITVFMPSSLRGREIEDFGIAVTDQWKLGKKKEDKGLMLLVAPKERKMRFEIGYGLEGDLTDVFTRRVLDETLRPLFREGRYFEGIVGALFRLQEKVPLGLDEKTSPQLAAQDDGGFRLPVHLILFLFFFVGFPLLSLIGRMQGGRRGRYYSGGWGGGGFGGGWGGGGSGGSSWGGGGGGFGGGGSSSNW